MPKDKWLYNYALALFEARWNAYKSGVLSYEVIWAFTLYLFFILFSDTTKTTYSGFKLPINKVYSKLHRRSTQPNFIQSPRNARRPSSKIFFHPVKKQKSRSECFILLYFDPIVSKAYMLRTLFSLCQSCRTYFFSF